jgi:hypothetical protein
MSRSTDRKPPKFDVPRDIHKAVLVVPPLMPQQHADFMGDLILLVVARLVVGNDEVLAHSGIGAIGLQIDPDDTKPWDRGGMLDPADRAAQGVNTAIPRIE